MKAIHFILKIMFLPCTVEIVIAGIVFLEEWIRSFT